MMAILADVAVVVFLSLLALVAARLCEIDPPETVPTTSEGDE